MEDWIPFVPAEVVTEILPTKIPLKIQNLGPEFVKKHVSLNASNKKEYTHHKVMMSCLTKYSFKDCNLSSLFDEYSVTDFDYPKKSYREVSIGGSANGLSLTKNDFDFFENLIQYLINLNIN